MSKHPLRLAVIGSSGKMGQEILSLAQQSPEFQITAGVGAKTAPLEPKHFVRALSELPAAEFDAVIDFSTLGLCSLVAEWCLKNNKCLVSGTTGIGEQENAAFAKAAAQVPVLWAPNMSLGVAVMAEMFKALKVISDYEFQIEELHHKHKKDKPSGTALFLQEQLKAALRPKSSTELSEPLSIRGGGIFGIHRLWAMGEEEIITIEHTAMNRKVFARGALRAAQWLVSQKPGLYKMSDVFA
jgi:4-hydroxy-tetrahydrodipicolinate reductase